MKKIPKTRNIDAGIGDVAETAETGIADAGIDTASKPNIRKKRTLERMVRWESAYAETGTVTSACLLSGVGRSAIYDWETNDVFGFRERWNNARESYADSLETLMHSRLHDPSGNRGSDVLLMFNLKARRPDIYREQTVIVGTGAVDLLATLRALPTQATAIDVPHTEVTR